MLLDIYGSKRTPKLEYRKLMIRPIKFSLVSICIWLSLAKVFLALGLVALQIYITSQFSSSEALELWDFKQHDSIFGYNKEIFGTAIHNSLFTAISLILVGPIIEELYFRRIILLELTEGYGLLVAVLISSVFWTVIHSYNIWLHIFISSIVISIVFIATKNILYPIIVHGLSNMMVWIVEGFFGTRLIESKDIDRLDHISEWYLEFGALVVAIIWVFFLYRKVMSHIANES